MTQKISPLRYQSTAHGVLPNPSRVRGQQYAPRFSGVLGQTPSQRTKRFAMLSALLTQLLVATGLGSLDPQGAKASPLKPSGSGETAKKESKEPNLLELAAKAKVPEKRPELPDRSLAKFNETIKTHEKEIADWNKAIAKNKEHLERNQERLKALEVDGKPPTEKFARLRYDAYKKFETTYTARIKTQEGELAKIKKALAAAKKAKREKRAAIEAELTKLLPSLIAFERKHRLPLDDKRLTHHWPRTDFKVFTSNLPDLSSSFDSDGSDAIQKWTAYAESAPDLASALRKVQPRFPHFKKDVGVQILMESTGDVACWSKKDNDAMGKHRLVVVMLGRHEQGAQTDEYENEAFDLDGLAVKLMAMKHFNVPESNIIITYPNSGKEFNAVGEQIKAFETKCRENGLPKDQKPELLWVVGGHGTSYGLEEGIPDGEKDRPGAQVGSVTLGEDFSATDGKLKRFANAYTTGFKTLFVADACDAGFLLSEAFDVVPAWKQKLRQHQPRLPWRSEHLLREIDQYRTERV